MVYDGLMGDDLPASSYHHQIRSYQEEGCRQEVAVSFLSIVDQVLAQSTTVLMSHDQNFLSLVGRHHLRGE
jgi:hypothetical protein